jgi:hypothetical protein
VRVLRLVDTVYGREGEQAQEMVPSALDGDDDGLSHRLHTRRAWHKQRADRHEVIER